MRRLHIYVTPTNQSIPSLSNSSNFEWLLWNISMLSFSIHFTYLKLLFASKKYFHLIFKIFNVNLKEPVYTPTPNQPPTETKLFTLYFYRFYHPHFLKKDFSYYLYVTLTPSKYGYSLMQCSMNIFETTTSITVVYRSDIKKPQFG